MARTPKNNSIYDKLNKNEKDITSTENLLKRLKSEREELLKEKDDFEMRKIFNYVKENNMSFDEAMKALSEISSAQKNNK